MMRPEASDRAAPGDVQVVPVAFEEKAVLRRLMELYLHDLSEFYPELRLDQHGEYGYRYLDHYWTEVDRWPFFISKAGRLAGFALIRGLANGSHEVAEFFVLRAFRRRGVGSHAAKALFGRFRGSWEVRQVAANVAAQAFWRRVIGEYTRGHYEEVREGDGDVVQRFKAG